MSEFDILEEALRGIRDERTPAANTARRIGTALLDILRRTRNGDFDEIIFNKVLNKPQFLQGLIALGTIVLGDFASGLRGGILTPEGSAELKDIWVREHARLGDGTKHYDENFRELPALEVEGDSVFSGNMSSPDFVSGFIGGTGWALQKKPFTNAAGVIEYKYVLECDGANIRGALRVYELIISQLLGENDNRIFTAMLEVHHFDPATGKVWMSTNQGKFYMPFRVGDCIMVQQYQPGNDVVSGGSGYIVKSYELIITEVGTGGATDENGDRLDWVRFKNFSTMMEGGPVDLIKEHDTFCRVDNLTDPERKGIIQLITVGTNAPYMDILYGLKTDPDHALVGRLGNLQGIHHHLFGWLQGFGEYLNNAYVVGDVRLRRTGESLDTAVEILNGLLASKMSEKTYEVTDEENFIRNASFVELDEYGNFRDWAVTGDNMEFYTLGGEPVLSSVGTLADVQSCVKTEEIDGSQVLHIVNASVRQSKNTMKQPGTHKEYAVGSGSQASTSYQTVRDTLYLSLRIRVVKEGELTIGFPYSVDTAPEAINRKTRLLERNSEWITLQWEGTWDGLTDFVLGFTGECYITQLMLTDDPLDDLETEHSTHIRQTARNISLVAERTSANETSIASLEITADQISLTVQSNYTDLDGRITANSSSITLTATAIRSEVQSKYNELDGRVTTNASSITQTAAAIRSEVQTKYNTLDGRITANSSSITQTAAAIRQEVRDTTNGLDTRIGTLETTSSSITGRLTAIENDYVVSSEISMMVKKNSSGYLESGVYVSADNITFDFTHTAQFFAVNGDQRTEVMNIRPNGDLWIKGDLLGGNIKGNYTLGTSGAKMEIFIDEALGLSKNSGIRGMNSNGVELLRLGFQEYSSKIRAFLRFGSSYYMEDGLTVVDNNGTFTVGIREGKAYLQAMHWPTEGVDSIGDLPPGTVYLRSDSCLGVRR